MMEVIHAAHLDTLLHAHFHASLLRIHPDLVLEAPTGTPRRHGADPQNTRQQPPTLKTPTGHNKFKVEQARGYTPLAKRSRGELPEETNKKYRERMEAKGRWAKGGEGVPVKGGGRRREQARLGRDTERNGGVGMEVDEDE